jgi:hypothetical protein
MTSFEPFWLRSQERLFNSDAEADMRGLRALKGCVALLEREATVTDEGDIVVRKPTNADVHATAEVLANAFADNGAYVWMHPRAATRASDLRAFFERNLRWHSPLDLTWVAVRGARIVGTSTLEPPGGVRSGVREAIAHWLVPTVRDQGPRTFLRTAAAGREFGERVLAEDRQMGVRWGSRGFRTWFMIRER